MSPSTIPPLNDAKSQTPCTGFPDPESAFKVDRSQTFDVDSVQLNGGIAVKVLVLSIDPYLRQRMREPGYSEYNSLCHPSSSV